MTTALYRRYRPDTFQEVIGQNHVTAPLMAALRGDRVTHAYLFSGPRGCGKTTSARILARCLNCERFPTDTPCGTCPSCRDLATGAPGSLDVVEIDAASHNGVDDARDLRERATFAPARDRYKIFILDEAHMVTPQGFNALLKLVEEPPAHVKFVFATTEPEKVIGTIRSRTHHYPFRLVPPEVLEGYLGQLCDAEGVGVGAGVFPLVVRAGGGSVRDTLSVMDQLIGGAVDGEVDYTRAVALLGYTDTTMLDQCVDAIAAGDGAGVFRVVDRVIASGHDPRRFVEDLLQRLRDLLVIALAGAEAGPALGSMPADQLARMEVQARTVGAVDLSRAADMSAQALGQMVGATSPRLQLELLMARLLVPSQRRATGAPGSGGPASSPMSGAGPVRAMGAAGSGALGAEPYGAVLSAVGADGGSAAAGAPASVRPGAPGGDAAGDEGRAMASQTARRAAEQSVAQEGSDSSALGGSGGVTPGTGGGTPHRGGAASGGDGGTAHGGGAAEAEMIRSRWDEVLEAAKRSRRATWALVGPNSQPGGIVGGVFEVLFTGQGLVNAFENGGHGPILSRAIHQALGLNLEVHAVLVGPSGPQDDGGSGSVGRTEARAGRDTGRPTAPPVASSRGQAPPHGASRAPWDGAGDAASPGAPEPWSADAPTPREIHPTDFHPDPWSADGPPASGTELDDDWGEVALPGGRRVQSPSDAGPQPQPQPQPGRTWTGAPTGGGVTVPAGGAVPGPAAPGLAQPGPAAPGPGSPDLAASSPEAPGLVAPEPASADEASDSWQPGGAQVTRPGRLESSHAVIPEPAAVRESAVERTTAAPPRSPETPGVDSHAEVAATPRDTAPSPVPYVPSPARAEAAPAAPEAQPAEEPDSWDVVVPGSGSPEDARLGVEDDATLATVHRLRALPDLPPQRPRAPQCDRAALSGDGPGTFSDGVPLPDEPGDPDGAQDVWTPGSRDRVSAAQAAARAAARGGRLGLASAASPPGPSLEEDLPSEDDEDAEEAGVVGLEVVRRLLGATVLEEVTVTQEGH